MPVPNSSFGTATAAIPLSQLDANFATPITLGNTAIQLGNTVTTLNNMTLANVTISSGTITITNVAVTTANVSGTANVSTLVVVGNETVGGNTTVGGNATVSGSVVLSGGTANGVAYLNTSKQLTTGSALTFNGTDFATTGKVASGSTGAAGRFDLARASDGGIVVALGLSGNDFSANNGAGGSYIFNINSSEIIRLTSTSLYTASTINVGIGTTLPTVKLDVAGQIRVNTTDNTSNIYLANSGTTYLQLRGNTTSAFINNPTAGPLIFGTSDTERARFNSTGALVFAGGTTTADGIGITFPATPNASTNANTLDAYEEGTWTPNLTGDGGGSGQIYVSQTGTYTKVGRVVTVGFYILLNTKGTITGNAIISNLPFTVLNFGSIVYGGALAYWLALGVNHNVIGIYTNTNSTNIYFWGSTGTASTPPLLTTTDIANNTRFWGSVTYMTA